MKRLLALAAVGALSLLPAGAAQAASTAAGGPTLRALAFQGLDRDVVGRESVGRSNGERDGRFTATLAVGKRAVLVEVVLQRVFAKGGYAEGWDTNPGTSASILGVVLDGKRLNPTDRSLHTALAPGTHRLEVSANDHYGVFAPGQLFRVTAVLEGNVAAAATTKLPGLAPSVTAAFAGMGSDVVGRGTDQKANGEPDAHFVVRLASHGSWQIVTNVTVRRLTAEGALDLPIWWMQGPQTAGLVVDGKRVTWPTGMPWWNSVYLPIDPKASSVRLDVYANDPSPRDEPSAFFGPGQAYRITVQFTDSELMAAETYAVVRL